MNPHYINPEGHNLPPPTSSSEQISPQMSNLTLGARPPSYGAPAITKSPLSLQDNSPQYINGSIFQGKSPSSYPMQPQNGPQQGYMSQAPSSMGPTNGPQGQQFPTQLTPLSSGYQSTPGSLPGQSPYRSTLQQGSISNLSAQGNQVMPGIPQNFQENTSYGLPNQTINQGPSLGKMPPPSTNQGPSLGHMPPPSTNQGPSLGQMPPPSTNQGPSLGHMPPPSTNQGPSLGQMPPPSTNQGPSLGQMPPPSTNQGPSLGYMPPPSTNQGPSLGQMPPPSTNQGPSLGQMPPLSANQGHSLLGHMPPPPTTQGPSILGQMPPPPTNQIPPGPSSGNQISSSSNSSMGNPTSAPPSENQLHTGPLPASNNFPPGAQLHSGPHLGPGPSSGPTMGSHSGPPTLDGMASQSSKISTGISPSSQTPPVTNIPTGTQIPSSFPQGNQLQGFFPMQQNHPIPSSPGPQPNPSGNFMNKSIPTQIPQMYAPQNQPPISHSSPLHTLPSPTQTHPSNSPFGSNVSSATNQGNSNMTSQLNMSNPYNRPSQSRPPIQETTHVNPLIPTNFPMQPRPLLTQNPNFQSNQINPNSPQPLNYPPPSSNMPPSKHSQYSQIPPQTNQMNQIPQTAPNQIPGMPPPPMGSLYGQMPPQQRQPEGNYPPQGYTTPMAPPQGQYGQPSYQGPPHMPLQNTMGQMPQNQAPRPMDPSTAPGARRLDPDQMPSPIQVMADDQRSRGGVFVTNQRGLVPPLVTTNFTVQDEGHCSPRLVRATTYTIPATPDMVKQTNVPLGLVISPLAENNLHISDFGAIGPVRCIRCKAYMSPMMQWIDGGRRFHCPLCKATTDTPAEYFSHLDHTGQRIDRGQRPELSLGAYELVATIDYCRDNILPQPPALIFALDVSYNSVRSGLLQLMCTHLRSVLECVPPSIRVGFVTYSSQVHFYNVSPLLAQPQRLTVPDICDVFVPLLEGFLVHPTESGPIIDQLLNELPIMFADTRETEVALWPVVKAGLEGLRAAQRSGRLIVFNTSLPQAEAPGKLRSRDERKLLGTDKERTILVPQNQSYNQLAQECVESGVGVDLFVMNNAYTDLATIGQLARLTGGQIYKYTYFQADLDGERLLFDLKHNVTRTQAFDAIMRVRTSTGIRATDFHGHMFMSNTIDMELATIDQDKGIAVELKHDDKLSEEEPVLIQVALLYTNIEGQRRLRIMNLGLRSSSQMADLYRACDLDAVLNLFSKQLIHRLLETAPKPAKDALVSRCASMLACYRKHCASPSSAGQLILPECMKLLPLYLNCLLRCDAVSGGPEMSLDDRSFAIYSVAIMDVPSSVVLLYPRLVPVTDLGENTKESTEDIQPLRCSYDKLREDGAFLLDNGLHMFLWMGLGLSSDWARDVFGVTNVSLVDTDRSRLPDLDTPRSVALREFIESTRVKRKGCMRLTLVRQRDKMENVFKHFLVEDRGFDGSASYVDFLCHMHKEIRTLLT